MYEIVPHLKARDPSGKIREYREPVVVLDFDTGLQPVLVELEDGSEGRGTCLGCHDAPCMTLAEEDIELPDAFDEFPGDPSKDVCPTGAVAWNAADDAVVVNGEACIGCGLCVARCPYGAISLNHEGVAVVECEDPDDLTVTAEAGARVAGHERPWTEGRIGPSDCQVLHQMPDVINNLDNHVGNRLIRNLLIECGVRCRTRRTGDTNVRMDGVLATVDERLGVLEIELGSDELEIPRALLEDVAVLHGRYGIDVESIDPVSVITKLPNARAEYFRVMADIEKVLNLRCRTVTVGALLAVLWQLETIEGFTGDLFVTSLDDTDLLPAMRRYLSASLPEEEPYPGAYRSVK